MLRAKRTVADQKKACKANGCGSEEGVQSERLRIRRRCVAVDTEQGNIPYAYGSHKPMTRFDARRISASFGRGPYLRCSEVRGEEGRNNNIGLLPR
jgi:hypothetical protein